MNEEIKEILDNLKKYEARYKLYNETQFIITHREIIILLDYITNLQKQLKTYENMRKEAIEYAKNSIDLLKPPSVSTINEEEYAPYIIIHDNYLNILNKVGSDK